MLSADPPAHRSAWRTLGWLMCAALVLTAIAAGVGLATNTLHQRADARPRPPAVPPLPVSTQRVRFQQQMKTRELYAGRLAAARETQLAFERSGLVTRVFVEQGDVVEAGQPIAALDVEPIEARRARLEAQIRQLQARVALAERTQARRGSLEQRGLGSTQALDEARFDAASLRAEMDAVRADLRVLDIDIAKSRLLSPFAGTIAERMLDEGGVVAAGTPIAMLKETGRPQARIGVPPRVATQLTAGATYPLLLGYDTVPARLTALRPDLDPASRTVVALFDVEPDAGLPPLGEVVRFAFDASHETRGTWLPVAALREGDAGLWSVFTVVDDGDHRVVAEESVEVLHTSLGRVFVRGTLQPGARVIDAGVNRVVRGQRVTLVDTAQ